MQELVYNFIFENTRQQYHGTSSTAVPVAVHEPQVISAHNVHQTYEYCDRSPAGSHLNNFSSD